MTMRAARMALTIRAFGTESFRSKVNGELFLHGGLKSRVAGRRANAKEMTNPGAKDYGQARWKPPSVRRNGDLETTV